MASLNWLSDMLYMFGGAAGKDKGDPTKVGFIFDCARMVRFYQPQVAFFISIGLFFGGLVGVFFGIILGAIFHI